MGKFKTAGELALHQLIEPRRVPIPAFYSIDSDCPLSTKVQPSTTVYIRGLSQNTNNRIGKLLVGLFGPKALERDYLISVHDEQNSSIVLWEVDSRVLEALKKFKRIKFQVYQPTDKPGIFKPTE